jgi:hypothetical protein
VAKGLAVDRIYLLVVDIADYLATVVFSVSARPAEQGDISRNRGRQAGKRLPALADLCRDLFPDRL